MSDIDPNQSGGGAEEEEGSGEEQEQAGGGDEGKGEEEGAEEAEASAAAEAPAAAAAPPQFRHANNRSAIVDDANKRFLVWAGDPSEVDGVVDELNSDPAAADRHSWLPGDPTSSVVTPASPQVEEA